MGLANLNYDSTSKLPIPKFPFVTKNELLNRKVPGVGRVGEGKRWGGEGGG